MGKHEKIFVSGFGLEEIQPGIWNIATPKTARAEVHVVGSRALISRLEGDRSLQQAVNVAHLPGVISPVVTMPDIHQGYGFPIGGVAAFHPKTGVVSPGGVGYDINCGIRLLTSTLSREQLADKKKHQAFIAALFQAIPCGVGRERRELRFSSNELHDILQDGSHWAVRRGFGTAEDRDHTEEGGRLAGADPQRVSEKAQTRGGTQLGTLGSGNHFVEIAFVDEIYDEKTAECFGLFPQQLVISVHTGSRGLGYQVCADYLEESFTTGDRELAAAPLESETGKHYLKAMACAANFAFANRQVITHAVREVFAGAFGGASLRLLYDVCHNIAKFEEMPGHSGALCIHRKGATRAYPAKHPKVPPRYREVGQPVLVPGDMGRFSFVLAGEKESMSRSYGSACHGAGRELSRAQAKKQGAGRQIAQELASQKIYVTAAGRQTLMEERPDAYKDVSEVVAATCTAGLTRMVARLKPLGAIKG